MRDDDYMYDSVVKFHNDLLAKGCQEIEILEFLRGWIVMCINSSQEYNLTNKEEYLKLLKRMGE